MNVNFYARRINNSGRANFAKISGLMRLVAAGAFRFDSQQLSSKLIWASSGRVQYSRNYLGLQAGAEFSTQNENTSETLILAKNLGRFYAVSLCKLAYAFAIFIYSLTSAFNDRFGTLLRLTSKRLQSAREERGLTQPEGIKFTRRERTKGTYVVVWASSQSSWASEGISMFASSCTAKMGAAIARAIKVREFIFLF